ncbi:MAG: TIGR01458 family HAD-type hydrolase [Gammaproteobacteria bacterium]
MAAILFDLDGVLYQGDRAIAGAAAAVVWFQSRNVPHLFVTNTTSRPRRALVEKLAGFGIRVDDRRLLTPPVAAVHWLAQQVPGEIALYVPAATRDEFAQLSTAAPGTAEVGAVVVGDLGHEWRFETLNEAFRQLMGPSRPPLVALGMTRYWQTPQGLQLDAGPFVAALSYAAGVEPVVMGKPAAGFFAAASAILGSTASGTVMIGDDIRGDIEGAQAAGLRTVLVRTGKFRPADLEVGVTPDAVLDSVADLPEWWRRHYDEAGD